MTHGLQITQTRAGRRWLAALAAAALATLLAGVIAEPAAARERPWSPMHQPTWLVVRGQPVTLTYGGVPRHAAGDLYVRNNLEPTFTRVPLDRQSIGGEPSLVASLPGGLVAGDRLFYYAVVRDPATGRSVTLPAAGAAGPQAVWVVRSPLPVALGRHHFGQLRAPDSIVASVGPKAVRFSKPPAGGACGDYIAQGPSSFDMAPDGSIWLLDELNHRLLVWPPRSPAGPTRTVSLPRHVAVRDFATGSDAIYIYAVDVHTGHGALYSLTLDGRERWKAPLANGLLRMGPGGTLYAIGVSEDAPSAWTPLTTPSGAPLSPAEQRSVPFQPLGDGLRLVTTQTSAHEVRYALVDEADRVVHAWQVTSQTELALTRMTPGLVGGDLVVALDVSHQARRGFRWEHLLLRLAPNGSTEQRFALDAKAVWGDDAVNTSPLRIATDGELYQLRTDPKTGASVARYSVGPTEAPASSPSTAAAVTATSSGSSSGPSTTAGPDASGTIPGLGALGAGAAAAVGILLLRRRGRSANGELLSTAWDVPPR
jgi:hypothetical protein